MVRSAISVFFALSLVSKAIAQQNPCAGSRVPPTLNGAGYELTMFDRVQKHAPARGAVTDGMGPVELSISYPLIANPITPDAKTYNATITSLVVRWWKDNGGPKDNTPATDPDTNYSLYCIPVGGAQVDGGPPAEKMLPGVVSVACGVYIYHLGGTHGGGPYSGFNWLLSGRRPIRASDIFAKNSGWLKALTALASADRQNQNSSSSLTPLDFSDTRHWVLGDMGLGLAYPDAVFIGYEMGGIGGVDLIPWSKLAPYLRKDGIVPQADWSATLSAQ